MADDNTWLIRNGRFIESDDVTEYHREHGTSSYHCNKCGGELFTKHLICSNMFCPDRLIPLSSKDKFCCIDKDGNLRKFFVKDWNGASYNERTGEVITNYGPAPSSSVYGKRFWITEELARQEYLAEGL